MKKTGILFAILLFISCEKFSYDDPDYKPFIEVISDLSLEEANYFRTSKILNIQIGAFSNLNSNAYLYQRTILGVSAYDSMRYDTVYSEINPLEYEVNIDTLHFRDTLFFRDSLKINSNYFKEIINDTIPLNRDSLFIYYKIVDFKNRSDSIRLLFIENQLK